MRLKRNLALRIDSHHRLIVAGIGAFICFLAIRQSLTLALALMISWNVFVALLIIMVAFLFYRAHPMEVRKLAGAQDSSRTFIFLLVATAACVSVFAVFFLLGSTVHLSPASLTRHVLLAISSVIFSWNLLHITFALRYAHLYYSPKNGSDREIEKGLILPGDEIPDYMDFAYFSFIVGMTFQVSDIEISSRRIRRLVLVHSLISFGFNTVIVALSINVISGMIGH